MQFDGLDPGYWVCVACDDSAAGLGKRHESFEERCADVGGGRQPRIEKPSTVIEEL